MTTVRQAQLTERALARRQQRSDTLVRDVGAVADDGDERGASPREVRCRESRSPSQVSHVERAHPAHPLVCERACLRVHARRSCEVGDAVGAAGDSLEDDREDIVRQVEQRRPRPRRRRRYERHLQKSPKFGDDRLVRARGTDTLAGRSSVQINEITRALERRARFFMSEGRGGGSRTVVGNGKIAFYHTKRGAPTKYRPTAKSAFGGGPREAAVHSTSPRNARHRHRLNRSARPPRPTSNASRCLPARPSSMSTSPPTPPPRWRSSRWRSPRARRSSVCSTP